MDSQAAARDAGLRYIDDRRPGITRRRRGKHFRLFPSRRQAGSRRSANCSASNRWRFRPPTTDVWISPIANGHIQATGTRRARPQTVPLPQALARSPRRGEVPPARRLRPRAAGDPQAVAKDLAAPDLSRRKVLAAVVALLDVDRHSRRQRRVRPGERLVRPNDAAHAPRQPAGFQGPPAAFAARPASSIASCSTISGSRASSSAAAIFRVRSSSITSKTTARSQRQLRRRQRLHPRDRRRGFLRQRFPHVDRHGRMHRRARRAGRALAEAKKQHHRRVGASRRAARQYAGRLP